MRGTDRGALHGFIRENTSGDTEAIYTDERPAHLDELEFRFNNRENPYMIRDAMLKLLLAETLPYAKL